MEEETKEEIVQETAETKPTEETITISEGQETEIIGKKSKPLNKKFIIILVLIVAGLILNSDYGRFKKEVQGKTTTPASAETPTVGADGTAVAPTASTGINATFTDYFKSRILQQNSIFTIEEATKFVNENLVAEGASATVKDVSEENGLWKLKLNINDQEYTTYLTKDKSVFFPQAITIAEIQQQKADAAKQAETDRTTALANLPKSEKPTAELFVMSHCPYGTQAEKGIIPVVEALGSKIDFKLKFCDYAMHDEKELKEEMNQYCIMQNQGDKFMPYLKCFLADGDGAKCLTQAGVDTNSLNTCVATTDSQYKIMAGYADKTTWKSGTYPAFPIFQADVDKYQVSGSPTLVVNGATIDTDRDSASMLKTICAGFTNKPEECNQSLSSTPPSSGFGYAEGTNTNQSCG